MGGSLAVPPRNRVEADAREPARSRLAGLFLPLTVNWLIVLYAVLALAIGWAYASLRIQSDYRQTLDMERNRLRGVAAVLESGTQAMINDGVGAALAGANAVMSSGGDMDSASGDRRSAALAKMLTGGDYVRSLFLYSAGRFARAGRDGTQETGGARPDWLPLPRSSLNGATWVGKPIRDPEAAGGVVIPIAQHMVTADRDGVWAGALFEFAAFDDLFKRLGRDLRLMGLVAADGTVLAIIPEGAAPSLTPGASIAGNELFKRANQRPEAGVVEGYGTAMQMDMLYGYERVHGYDMTILAGQSLDAVLEPWRDRRRTTLMVTTAASTLIGLVTWMLGLHLNTHRRLKQLEDAHVRRVKRESAALLSFASRHGGGAWNDVQVALREICEQACDVLETDRVAAWKLMPGGRLRCVEHFDRNGRRHEQGFEIATAEVTNFLEAVRGERVIDVQNAGLDPRTQELKAAMAVPDAVGMIAAPVRCSGKLAGVVMFEHLGIARSWHADEVSFAGGVADQIAQAYLDSERAHALMDLRRMASELMRLQDEERRRIGRDLHDSTGQTLAALELSLNRLMNSRASGAEQRELLEQCVHLASQCSAEIRTASYLLHPPLLDELGLLSALRWLADGLRDRSGIDVQLDLPASMNRLTRDEELTLFRVAQEALTNIHRHSDSPWAWLRLSTGQDGVVLEIEDGGVGIRSGDGSQPEDGLFALGVGLAGMRERIQQVGGTFTVEAGRSGTVVRATLPIADHGLDERLSA